MMTQETPTISAERRERTGSRYARRLRQAGRLPAVVYGHRMEPLHVSVDEKELLHLIRHGSHVMTVEIDGRDRETCLVKDIQFGYLGDDVIHVDFARVNLDEEVEVLVRADFVGTPAEAHHAGAILRHEHTEIGVRCKVNQIPEDIKVDLGTMEGMHLTAREIPLPAGVALAMDPDTLLVSISFLKKKAEVGEEAEVPSEEAEPEVISEARAEAASEDGSEAGA